MIVEKEAISEAIETEPYKVKCKNCTGGERHENYFWCDFWCTEINDAETSYCSYFVPNKPIGDENNNVSKDKKHEDARKLF